MTLDEAIRHAEEVAEEQDKLCKRYDDASGYTRSGNENIRTNEAKKCAVCAEEHRMLAWWLRDYKRLKEQEPCGDAVSRQAVHEAITRWAGSMSVLIALPTREIRPLLDSIHELPPVEPSYSDNELDTIQRLEQAQIEKAYQLGQEDRPTGHWICGMSWKCSECGYEDDRALGTDFCPSCGARMEGEQNG